MGVDSESWECAGCGAALIGRRPAGDRCPGCAAGNAVQALDAIDAGDPEAAHDAADTILLGAVAIEIAEAYRRLQERCDWWAWA